MYIFFFASTATAFGVLPTIEINGKEYFQGNAIATYLARENGEHSAKSFQKNLVLTYFVLQ